MSFQTIDYLFAERYFQLETGSLAVHKGNRLEITIPAVAQSAETDEADEDQNLNILQKIHDGEDLPTLIFGSVHLRRALLAS